MSAPTFEDVCQEPIPLNVQFDVIADILIVSINSCACDVIEALHMKILPPGLMAMGMHVGFVVFRLS